MLLSNWILLSLTAPLLLGIVNLLDKFVLYRYKLTPLVYFSLDGFVGIVISLLLFKLSDNPLYISNEAIILSMLAGLALAIFNLLYFYAIRKIDVVIIGVLIQSTPVFTLYWGLLFLKEHYKFITYIGMLFVLIGTIIAVISEKKMYNRWKFWTTKTFRYSLLMLIAALSLSIAYFIQNRALQMCNYLVVFFWQRVCIAILSLLGIIISWRDIKKLSINPVIITSIIEIIASVGLLLMTIAFSEGPLASVTFLSSVQPVWILIIARILVILKIFNSSEDKNVGRLYLISSCLLVVTGIYLIKMG